MTYCIRNLSVFLITFTIGLFITISYLVTPIEKFEKKNPEKETKFQIKLVDNKWKLVSVKEFPPQIIDYCS